MEIGRTSTLLFFRGDTRKVLRPSAQVSHNGRATNARKWSHFSDQHSIHPSVTYPHLPTLLYSQISQGVPGDRTLDMVTTRRLKRRHQVEQTTGRLISWIGMAWYPGYPWPGA